MVIFLVFLYKITKIMFGKLIKTEVNYILEDDNGVIIDGKLSHKNCQSIENGYEFDEYEECIFYAGKFGYPLPEGFSDEQVGRLHGFIDGFQKALEILGNKKFTEYDILVAMISMQGQEVFYEKTFEETLETRKLYIENYIKNLKKTECNVEIVTKPYTEVSEGFNLEQKREFKVDKDGCLILKRI